MNKEEMAQYLFVEGNNILVETMAPNKKYARVFRQWDKLGPDMQEWVLERGLELIEAGGLGHKYKTLEDAEFFVAFRGMIACGNIVAKNKRNQN